MGNRYWLFKVKWKAASVAFSFRNGDVLRRMGDADFALEVLFAAFMSFGALWESPGRF